MAHSSDIDQLAGVTADGHVHVSAGAHLAGTAQEWQLTFAMLMASGTSLEACCLKLGRPKALLEKVLTVPHFQQLLTDVASEIGGDLGLNLIKGSTTDNVLRLLALRDASTTKPDLVAKICFQLIDIAVGRDKKGLQSLTSGAKEAMQKLEAGGEQGLLEELFRLVDNDPAMRVAFKAKFGAQTPDAPSRMSPLPS